MAEYPHQVMPLLSDEEYQALKSDIAKRGVLVAVEKDEEGHILDGYHRDRAWHELKEEGIIVPCPVTFRVGLTEDQKILHAQSLNLLRRHLTNEQRAPIWRDWRARWRMSYRQIAEKSGVGDATVRRALAGASFDAPDTVLGADGKSYPAQKPKPEILKTIITDGKSESKIIEGIKQVGVDALPDKAITEKRAGRIIREAQAEQQRQEIVDQIAIRPEVLKPPSCRFEIGDFREKLCDVPPGTVELICTDPPYGQKFLPQWDALAQFADVVLCPGGYLVTYSGQTYLPQVLIALSRHLEYVWIIAQINGSAKKTILQQKRFYSVWKPILVFCKPPYNPFDWTNDLIRGQGMEKDLHAWQQGESEVRYCVEHFSKPDGIVLDPFLGSGTTAVVCKQLRRQFIGCDIDPASVAKTLKRISD